MLDLLFLCVFYVDMVLDIVDMVCVLMDLCDDVIFFEVMVNNLDLLCWYIDGFYGDVFKFGCVFVDVFEVLCLCLFVQYGCKFCNQGNWLNVCVVGLSDVEIDVVFMDDFFVFCVYFVFVV